MKVQNKVLGTITLLVVMLLAIGCGGAEQRKAKYLARGSEYLEQQNYDKAIVELKNALQIDPKLAEAYYLIGKAEENKENWQRAFGSYSKAAELDPNHTAAQASLGRFYLLSKEIEKAEEIAQKILASKPHDPEGKTLKAAILYVKKDVPGATKLAQEVISADPSQISTISFLADIYLQQEQLDKAREVLEKAVTGNPKNASLRIQLSRLYFRLKNNDKAEEQLKTLIALDPKNLPYQGSLVAFYRQTKQLDKAEELIKELIKADPKDPQRHILLAEFLATEKSVEQAEKQLLASIEEYPKMYELRFGLAGLYDQTRKPDLAEKQYREIIDGAGMEPQGLKAQVQLASLLLKQGKPVDEPERIINQVLKENPKDNAALLLRGKLSLTKGQPQDAVVAFRSILKDAPNSVEVLALLGDAHLLNGETELAKENLLKAVKLNPENPNAKLLLARYYARTGDHNAALKTLDEILQASPKHLDALQARVEIFSAKRDLKELQAAIMKVKESYPDDPRSYNQLGQFYLSQKKFDAAIQEFDLALKKSEAYVLQPLVGIVNAHVAQGKPERAINRLTALIKETPNHPFAHELLAQLYYARKDYTEAEKQSRVAIEVNPKWNAPYITLSNYYVTRGELVLAEEVYQQGLQAIPEDIELLLYVAQFHERNRNFEKAVATYERILQKNQNSDIATNNLAALLTDRLGDAESLKKAITLASRFESSPQPAFRDTLGWAYLKNGEADKALAVLKDVVKQAPNTPIFRYHLGMAYHKQGNLSEAKTQLAKAIESKNDFTGKDEARKTLQQIP